MGKNYINSRVVWGVAAIRAAFRPPHSGKIDGRNTALIVWRMIIRRRRVLAAALACLVLGPALFAQTTNARTANGVAAPPGFVADTARRIIHLDAYEPTPGDVYTLTMNFGINLDTGQASTTENIDVILQSDYTLELPYVGSINVRTLSYEELRREVATRVKARAFAQFVSLNLTAPAVFDVLVWGGVGQPGFQSVSSLTRLVDAIDAAGGTASSGSQRMVQVTRDGDTITHDLIRYTSGGDESQNPLLRPDDRIFVPTVEASVTLNGAVLRPGALEVLPGETIGDIIDLAGGLRPTAQIEKTSVSRLGENNRYEILRLDDVDLTSLPAKDGDIVTIPASTTTTDLIQVEGAIYPSPAEEGSPRSIPMQPILLDVPYTPGITVLRILERFGGPTPFAELDRSFVIRAESSERSPIPDLGTIWEERAWDRDIPLSPGDRLVIPMKRLVVSVGGQVNSPGGFSFTSGYVVADYLELAGGIVEQDGSADRLFFAEPDGSLTRVSLETPVPVGSTIYVDRSGWGSARRTFDNIFTVTGWVTGLLGVATVIIQFVQLFVPDFP